MRAVETLIGKVVVLAPTVETDRLIARLREANNRGEPMLADVEEECLTCGGSGWIGGYGDEIPCPDACGTGTVSVPHVVTEVLPIVRASGSFQRALHVWDEAPEHYDPTVPVVDIGDRNLFTLPDAQPGGVVLIVERGEDPS